MRNSRNISVHDEPLDPAQIWHERHAAYVKKRYAKIRSQRFRAVWHQNRVIDSIASWLLLVLPLGMLATAYLPIWAVTDFTLAACPLLFLLLRRLLPDRQPLPCERCLASFRHGILYCPQCGHERERYQRPWNVKHVVFFTSHTVLIIVLGVGALPLWRVCGWPCGSVGTLTFFVGFFRLFYWKDE